MSDGDREAIRTGLTFVTPAGADRAAFFAGYLVGLGVGLRPGETREHDEVRLHVLMPCCGVTFVFSHDRVPARDKWCMCGNIVVSWETAGA